MTEDVFQKNMHTLRENGIEPPVFSQEKNDSGCFSVHTTRIDSSPTIRVRTPFNEFFLHSRYDPVKEARRFVEALEDYETVTTVVLYGFGLGYHIELMLELCRRLERMVVVECNMDALKLAFETRKLENILGDRRITLLAGSFDEIRKDITKFTEEHEDKSGSFKVVVHSPSLKIVPEDAVQVKQIFEYMSAIRVHRNVKPFERIRVANIMKYASLPAHSPGISVLKNMFAGQTAIIAGAGPSLDINLPLLKVLRKHALLFAVDSALDSLLHNGIQPHFTLLLDPQLHQKKHFTNIMQYSGFLVHSIAASPDIVLEFDRNRRFAAVMESDAEAAGALPYCGDDILPQCPNVLFMGVLFANYTGISSIVLAGADFALSTRSTHSVFSKAADHFMKKAARGASTRMVDGYFGGEVETDLGLYIYLRDIEEYISKHPGIEFINATVGGASVRGACRKPLEEIYYELAAGGADVQEVIAGIECGNHS